MESRNEGNPSSSAAAVGSSGIDRFEGLLDRFRVRAELFHAGPLCGLHVFEPVPGRAFIHVLRRGAMGVVHQGPKGSVRTRLSEPTLLFFARPVHHVFENPPVEGADFTCATLDLGGGDANPLVRAFPAMLAIPIAAVGGLHATLELLFSETDRLRCGSRLLAGRVFEVLVVQILRWALDNPVASGIREGPLAGLSHPKLAKALVAVHASPASSWSLARLAQAAGMSRSGFAATFREVVGISPAAYVLEWRLGLAADQIRDGRSLKQVAVELGFRDPSVLARALRRVTGAGVRATRHAGREC